MRGKVDKLDARGGEIDWTRLNDRPLSTAMAFAERTAPKAVCGSRIGPG